MAYGKQHPAPQTPTLRVKQVGTKVARYASDNSGSDALGTLLDAIHGTNWSRRGNGTFQSQVKAS